MQYGFLINFIQFCLTAVALFHLFQLNTARATDSNADDMVNAEDDISNCQDVNMDTNVAYHVSFTH
jgi:hypothetical protein